MFKDIAPELFDKELRDIAPHSEDNRWSHAPLMGVLPRNYLDPSADDLFKELGVPVSTTLGATSWSGVMDRRPRLMCHIHPYPKTEKLGAPKLVF